MTKDALIEDIEKELTFSRALPFALPKEELARVIDISSKFFYDNWHYAIQQQYLMVPLDIFQTEQFKRTREVRLPDCIQFVYEVKEIKGGSVFGTIDRDFSEQKFVGSEIFLTPFMGESIMYRTAIFSFLDLTKKMIIDTIAYDWNKNNKVLFVKGRTPIVPVVVICGKKISEDSLYEDELFQRYVRAKAKVRMGELITVFKFKLPGNIDINYETMVTKAEVELTAVIDAIKGETTPSFMLVESY